MPREWTTMSSRDLRSFVESFVRERVEASDGKTEYRRPLIGFADAGDPDWLRLREIAEPSHLLPGELLPGAKTVVAFFLPFAEDVVRANRKAKGTAKEWDTACFETNDLINGIGEQMIEALRVKGVRAARKPATHNWDPVTLVSRWSHKSAAAMAGLGTFGVHRMLITDLGCAGRFGSLVVDAQIPPTSRPQPERCRFFHDGGCEYCVKACPAGVLRCAGPSDRNLDKHGCHAHILDVKAELGADCCGKCALGPCALGTAVRQE